MGSQRLFQAIGFDWRPDEIAGLLWPLQIPSEEPQDLACDRDQGHVCFSLHVAVP